MQPCLNYLHFLFICINLFLKLGPRMLSVVWRDYEATLFPFILSAVKLSLSAPFTHSSFFPPFCEVFELTCLKRSSNLSHEYSLKRSHRSGQRHPTALTSFIHSEVDKDKPYHIDFIHPLLAYIMQSPNADCCILSKPRLD